MKTKTAAEYLNSEFNGHKGDFADAFGVFRQNLVHYWSGEWLVIVNKNSPDLLVKVAKERKK